MMNLPSNDPIKQLYQCSLGVVLFQDCTLARWSDGNEEPQLRFATFTTSAKPVHVECQVSTS